MFKELVQKELREHLLSLRFQIGLILVLVLGSASSFVLSSQYRREAREISERTLQNEDFLSKYAHLNRVGNVLDPVLPPSVLVLFRGLPDPANIQTLDSNPLPSLFRPADLTTIVALVFSLLGIVLGFDAVNSEKERGTLRLILANRLRRFDVLAAKWMGGMLVLVAALILAWLVASLVVLASSGTHWGTEDTLTVVALWAFSMLYCAAFFSLGLALSAVTGRSSVSILSSLFAWTLLAFVLPNISPYVASQIVRVPSLAVLQRDLQYVESEQRDDLGEAGTAKVYEQFGCVWVSNRLAECTGSPGAGTGKKKFTLELSDADRPSDEIKRRIAADPEFRQFYDQLSKAVEQVWADVNRKQGEKAGQMRAAWRAKADQQFNLAKEFSYSSPLPPLVYASTDLSLTGFATRRRFDQQVGAYYEKLETYLWNRYHEEQAKNPAYSVNDFLDVHTRPRFTFSPPRFSERLADALPYAAMLVGWNIAFFVAALAGFLRFDVR